MKNIMVVAPHPDDETLGCGGTIIKHIKNGDNVIWCIVTNIKEDYGYSKDMVIIRQNQIKKVSKLYNFRKVIQLEYQPANLDYSDMGEIVHKLSSIIKDEKINIIYIPNCTDVHSDHKIISEAAMSATKSFRNSYVKKIIMYETLSETEFGINPSVVKFVPNYFVNITEYIDKKINIMNIFESEIGKAPFPRSSENIRALAVYRGCTCGHRYAEAFMKIKEIED